MRVRYTPQAHRDLVQIIEYLVERSPGGARNVRRAIDRTTQLISEHPYAGRLAGEGEARVLPAGRYPYWIYWIVEDGEAWIVHIRHAARRRWTAP
jgi:toxin ParE1/3/4